MITAAKISYVLICKAIDLIKAEGNTTIHLETIAEKMGMTYPELNQLFLDWGGLDLQQFLRSISQERIHDFLTGTREQTLFEHPSPATPTAPYLAHAFFTKIIPMSEEESGQDGANLCIDYDFEESPFGLVITGSTTKGVCYMAFEAGQEIALSNLKKRFPKANLNLRTTQFQQDAVAVFKGDWQHLSSILLHMKGTPFQIRVWQELLKVPLGTLTTYSKIAEGTGRPDAPRATGTAIGRNPIAYLIPCHRIIQSGGKIGKYMWGTNRKLALIAWESIKRETF